MNKIIYLLLTVKCGYLQEYSGYFFLKKDDFETSFVSFCVVKSENYFGIFFSQKLAVTLHFMNLVLCSF